MAKTSLAYGMMKNTNDKYVVRPCPYSRKGWAIVNRLTGEVMEGGFFSKDGAQEYIWKEYQD